MFGTITEKRLKYLLDIADNLPRITFEEIEKSKLPVFNKKFIFEEADEITDKKHLESLLDKSVKLNINYAVRPKWTLINYLYGGFDSKSADEVFKKAEIFQFYRFYSELILNYIKSNSPIFMTSAKVTEFIDETNIALFEKLNTNLTGLKVKNFFIQIFKLKYGEDKEITLDDSIPFVFVRIFLEDKNFIELLDKFKVIDGLKDNDEVELKVLIKVLMNKYEKSYDSVSAEEESKSDEIVNGDDQSGIQDKKEKEPEFRKIKISSSVEINDSRLIEEPEKIIQEKPKAEIREEINITDTFERHIPSPESKKIKRLFKEGELNIIAKKVFKSSRLSMFSAFEELEKLNTWEEAVSYLKEIFKKNNVDMYNKNVVLFIDLLNDYYTNLEKGYI
jgi:hypothetical protein